MTTNEQPAARSRIFAKLRSALKDGPDAASRRPNVEQRLANPPVQPRLARVGGDKSQLTALFREFLEGQFATVIEVSSAADVPHAVSNYLRTNNLPQAVRFGDDALLAALPWTDQPALRLDRGAAASTDETGLSRAFAGIAETGTLALVSGAENPVTVTFVPETHIIVVEAGELVGTYEDVWAKVRARYGKGVMPRTVNFVSGPSRTADIAGTLVTGAHGPRRLCVIIVGP